MNATKDRFWAKVLFKEFIRHYRKMTPEQKVADIDESMDDLEELDDSGDSFGAKMVRWSMERVEQYPMARENGKKGGRPRKDTTADGDTREDSQDRKSGTSANNYTADAPTREDGEFKSDSSNAGNLESATSANSEARQSQARESQGRTGAPSTGATSSTAPVRSYRPRKVPHPEGESEVFDFASDNAIPDWVANEFYQRFFVERDGTDNDGNNIDNWKGALINYNKSRKR